MPMWGNTEVAGNSAIFAPAQVKQAPDATNRNALFGNTTANAYFGSGETIGQYGVTVAEMRAVRAGGEPRPAGPGWVLRTEGAGGRAGRVSNELLVAMKVTAGGGDEDLAFPDFATLFSLHPVTTTANGITGEIAEFTANAYNVPAGGSITYKWQKYDAGWANVNNGGAYSNTTTKALSVVSNAVVNGESYRVGTYQSGADTEYSSNASIDIYPHIEFIVQPADAQGDDSANEIVEFTAEANADSQPISYKWQKYAAGWANVNNGGAYSNTATAELSVLANTAANGEVYRCGVYVTDTLIVSYSGNATLTVVA